MRNRRTQRELHKLKEEKLDKKDSAGLYDPTPYYAVLRIRNKERISKETEEIRHEGSYRQYPI